MKNNYFNFSVALNYFLIFEMFLLYLLNFNIMLWYHFLIIAIGWNLQIMDGLDFANSGLTSEKGPSQWKVYNKIE